MKRGLSPETRGQFSSTPPTKKGFFCPPALHKKKICDCTWSGPWTKYIRLLRYQNTERHRGDLYLAISISTLFQFCVAKYRMTFYWCRTKISGCVINQMAGDPCFSITVLTFKKKHPHIFSFLEFHSFYIFFKQTYMYSEKYYKAFRKWLFLFIISLLHLKMDTLKCQFR